MIRKLEGPKRRGICAGNLNIQDIMILLDVHSVFSGHIIINARCNSLGSSGVGEIFHKLIWTTIVVCKESLCKCVWALGHLCMGRHVMGDFETLCQDIA
jgi:hypothetical protein